MPLTTKDYKKILDILDIAYSIPERSEMLRTVFDELQKILPFTSAVYTPIIDHNIKEEGSFTYNCLRSQVKSYIEYYASLDPFVTSKILENDLNKSFRNTDITLTLHLAELVRR